MEQQGKSLNAVILVLTIVTVVSLLGAALGVVIEGVIPAYFWYLALLSMLMLSLLWIVMAAMLIVNQSIEWYRREYVYGNWH
jgi:hypothetical protein